MGNVAARDFGLGIARRQNLVHASVAVLALGDIGVSRRSGFSVNPVIVGRLLVSVAGCAYRFGRGWIVREGLYVGVAVGAAEDAVDGVLELGVVDVQADLLAIFLFDEGRVAMACEAFVIAHLGSSFRRGRMLLRGCRRRLGRGRYGKKQSSKKDQTAAFHRISRFRWALTDSG